MFENLKNKITKNATGLKGFAIKTFDGGFVKKIFKGFDRQLGGYVFSQLDAEEVKESFSTAVKRFNRSEQDLVNIRNHFVLMSRIYFFFFLATIALGIKFFSLASVIAAVGFCAFPLSLWFKWSFRAWQIRIRRLSGVNTFLKTQGWWKEFLIPSKLYTPSGN